MGETSDRCFLCETEGRKICAAIFGREVPLIVLDRFVVASKQSSFLRGALSVAWAALHTAWKMLAGLWRLGRVERG